MIYFICIQFNDMVSSILINDSVIYVDICFTNQVEFVAVSNRISYII